MALLNSTNAFNNTRGVLGLFSPLNKGQKKPDEGEQDSLPIGEFESKLTTEEINQLTSKWISEYDSYAKDIKQQQKDNVNYWIGKHYNDLQIAGTKKPLVDNLIFEAIETFLPIATRATPEANVSTCDNQQSGDLTSKLQQVLNFKGDDTHLRMKLKKVTRNWVLYLIGACKIVWDESKNDFDLKVVLPSRLILDPNAEIDVDGKYLGEYLGEKKRITARKLARMFPSSKTAIAQKCDNQWGTKLWYTEWWTARDVFFTLDSIVLGKFKNPHWNYNGKMMVKSATGEMIEEEIVGKNHLEQPEIPYLFLSIFNLGRRPHDETSLIQQNISIQDNINKRYTQIDRNVESQNNGIVLSGKYFTKEQAAEAAVQLSRGNPLWVPEGDIGQAYKRDQASALSADIYRQLQDSRQELRNIFGTAGSNPEGLKGQESVRGKIMINQMDSSRIGGGITEYIETLSATIYNWYVQMMYVYYTEERQIPILNSKQGEKLLSIINTDFAQKVHVTVKSGSLVPKDPLTQRNEAMDLWSAQGIDPRNFFKKLDFPDPDETAKELFIWTQVQQGKMDPTAYFPDLQINQPMPATGIGNTGIVSNAEDNHSATPNPEPVGVQSQQLLASVPLQ